MTHFVCVQVLCSRPPGTRGRKGTQSETMSDDTWFGTLRQSVDRDNTVFATVVVEAGRAGGRRVATGCAGQEAAVQVARDTVALLLARLPRLFKSAPINPVHGLTLAVLEQCRLHVRGLEDRHQPVILVPTHLFAAVRAFLAHRPTISLSESVGHCTARLACALRVAAGGSLPETLWSSLRGAAVATMAARDDGDHTAFQRGVSKACNYLKADVGNNLQLAHRGAFMAGIFMSGISGRGGTAAQQLRDFVAGSPAPGTGVATPVFGGHQPADAARSTEGGRVPNADVARGLGDVPPQAADIPPVTSALGSPPRRGLPAGRPCVADLTLSDTPHSNASGRTPVWGAVTPKLETPADVAMLARGKRQLDSMLIDLSGDASSEEEGVATALLRAPRARRVTRRRTASGGTLGHPGGERSDQASNTGALGHPVPGSGFDAAGSSGMVSTNRRRSAATGTSSAAATAAAEGVVAATAAPAAPAAAAASLAAVAAAAGAAAAAANAPAAPAEPAAVAPIPPPAPEQPVAAGAPPQLAAPAVAAAPPAPALLGDLAAAADVASSLADRSASQHALGISNYVYDLQTLPPYVRSEVTTISAAVRTRTF